MRTSKIIKRIAKEEGVSVDYIKTEMQKAIDMANWSKLGSEQASPNSIDAALSILHKELK